MRKTTQLQSLFPGMGHHLISHRLGIAQAEALWSQNFRLSHRGNQLLLKDQHSTIISRLKIAGILEMPYNQRICSVKLAPDRPKIRADLCGSNHRKRNLGMLQTEISGVTSRRRLSSKISIITTFAVALQEKFAKQYLIRNFSVT